MRGETPTLVWPNLTHFLSHLVEGIGAYPSTYLISTLFFYLRPGYRPVLFYRTPEQLATIERVKAELQKDLKKNIATEVAPFEKFWSASDYHQNFVRLHPDQN